VQPPTPPLLILNYVAMCQISNYVAKLEKYFLLQSLFSRQEKKRPREALKLDGLETVRETPQFGVIISSP
jgi:hypothetical protein